MTYILRCGRLPEHEPHDWRGDPNQPWGRDTYHCTGHVIVAGGERTWDDEDDAAEERAIQDRRERETA